MDKRYLWTCLFLYAYLLLIFSFSYLPLRLFGYAVATYMLYVALKKN